MEEVSTAFVGLDVHSQSTAIAVAHAGREAPRFVGTVGARLSELIKALDKLGKPSTLLVVYEAGPCGYTLVRELRAKGYRCEVVAPSLIARKPAERVKTDRRDALKLAALARSGDLTTVNVPDEQDEAIRDLCRARVDAVKARLKARRGGCLELSVRCPHQPHPAGAPGRSTRSCARDCLACATAPVSALSAPERSGDATQQGVRGHRPRARWLRMGSGPPGHSASVNPCHAATLN